MTFDLICHVSHKILTHESQLYLCIISKHFLLLKFRLLEFHYMLFKQLNQKKNLFEVLVSLNFDIHSCKVRKFNF